MAEVWTIKKILDWTVEFFQSKNVSEPRLSAEWLLAHVLGCKRIDLYLQFERILTPGERAEFKSLILRRARHEPVAYITGQTEFMGLPFRVTPAVLIPRPETELLVETVIEMTKQTGISSPAILDIGTGSGCIAISLAKFIEAAEVWAVDVSEEAIAVARENARLNNVEINFVHGNIGELAGSLNKTFDVVVSNPPYVSESEWETLAPDVRLYEPPRALLGGKDGLDFYRKLKSIVPHFLKEAGKLVLEIGDGQAGGIQQIFNNKELKIKILKDYQNIERVVIIDYEKTDKR